MLGQHSQLELRLRLHSLKVSTQISMHLSEHTFMAAKAAQAASAMSGSTRTVDARAALAAGAATATAQPGGEPRNALRVICRQMRA